jgi:hypothetical protein
MKEISSFSHNLMIPDATTSFWEMKEDREVVPKTASCCKLSQQNQGISNLERQPHWSNLVYVCAHVRVCVSRKRHLHIHVYCGTIHYSQVMETAKMPHHRRMD